MAADKPYQHHKEQHITILAFNISGPEYKKILAEKILQILWEYRVLTQ